MHINVTVGLLGLHRRDSLQPSTATATRGRWVSIPTTIALAAKLTMAGLLLIYVNLCVRSFIQARRSRQE